MRNGPLRGADVVAAVAAENGVSVSALVGRGGSRFARAEAMYLLRRPPLEWSYGMIARRFRRHRSTVHRVVARYEAIVGAAAPDVWEMVEASRR